MVSGQVGGMGSVYSLDNRKSILELERQQQESQKSINVKTENVPKVV